jgi:hypothetical protein
VLVVGLVILLVAVSYGLSRLLLREGRPPVEAPK